MRTLRQICAALMLTIVLSLNVPAGQIEIPFLPPPPPPGDQSNGGRIGEISTGNTATDIAIRTALGLYQSMLAVF